MTVLFDPILALHIINFSSCRNYWGGGGGAKRYVCPPPRIDASECKRLGPYSMVLRLPRAHSVNHAWKSSKYEYTMERL